MAEDLTDYLHEHDVRVRYLHSDIETVERVEIIRDLRLGQFDVLVGINLLREGLDMPEVSLVAILDELFRSAPLAAWRERLDRNKVTFGVITRAEEAPDDPQMRANHLFREIEGGGGRRVVDSPIWIAGVEKAPPRRAPEIGEHGREVLRELGYGDGDIADLHRRGVIAGKDL